MQWANEEIAGLAFVRISEDEEQRLDNVMTTTDCGETGLWLLMSKPLRDGISH